MIYTSTVTQKGQITLPKKVRDAFRIKKNEKVKIESKKGYIKIAPTEDILSLAGKYKAGKKKTSSKAREKMERVYKRV